MDWLWGWLAFSIAAGAFYEAFLVKKENKQLKARLDLLEDEVYK